MSQKVVSAGTTGLPSPVRRLLSGRIVAGLIVLCLPLLFISGIVSVDFENGRPHLSFNRDKAKEAKELECCLLRNKIGINHDVKLVS